MVLGTAGALGSADLESVCEATVDNLQVLRSAGAGGLASLGLLAPVDCFMKNNVPSKRTRSDLNKSNFSHNCTNRGVNQASGNSYTCGS